MAIQTPNMFLYLPTLGVDSGITWETDVNANSDIIDGHNHSVGSGVQINPDGININADLAFNDNNAITLRSVRFFIQPIPISAPNDLGCLYVSGFDLYFNDELGNQIQITKGGNVNATSSGISDGTATASFVANTLVVDSASNTPANIQGASLLLGNTGVTGSFYVTLSPPNALASSYSLTLPALPSQTNVMTLTPAGVMSSISYDQVGINMTSVGANAIQASRTMPLGTAALNLSITASSGTFSTISTSPVIITNFQPFLTTTGRPVFITIENDQTGFGGIISIDATANSVARVQIVNNVTGAVATYTFFEQITNVGTTSSGLIMTDYSVIGAPATYGWQAQAYIVSGSGEIHIDYMVMTVREL
jgi:hypothetical protein